MDCFPNQGEEEGGTRQVVTGGKDQTPGRAGARKEQIPKGSGGLRTKGGPRGGGDPGCPAATGRPWGPRRPADRGRRGRWPQEVR